MFDRKSRILILLFSILLWAQLIFSLGLMGIRYWSVYASQSEIFVGVSPTRTEPLIDYAREHCPDEASLLYIGPSEADKLYVRYQFYPRRIKSIWVEPSTLVTGELVVRRFGPWADITTDGSCLLIDRLDDSLSGFGTQMILDSEQSIILFGN